MSATFLTLALALLAAEPPTEPRKPNPFFPSLPLLTREEEAKLDQIIDRFILYDTGRLPGEEGKQALREFEQLGPEAIPALIRGLNRGAMLDHSCPTLVIGAKLRRMLLASDDGELLEFARDNIGAGVRNSRHARALEDLRFQVLMRKNALARRPPPPPKTPRTMTNAELYQAASVERGQKLLAVLAELETRRGPEVFRGLAIGASSSETDVRTAARDALDRVMSKQPASVVKEKLQDTDPEVRGAAIRAAGTLRLVPELIDLLANDSADVRAAARSALRTVSKSEDFGPALDADAAERRKAQQNWRDWWARQGR
jgi:hypothetical protein